MKKITNGLLGLILLGFVACTTTEDSGNYEQIGFYTLRNNAEVTEKTDTAVVKIYKGGKLVEECFYGTVSDKSLERMRYDDNGDMISSELSVPSAGYLSKAEIGYAKGRYMNSYRTSIKIGEQAMTMGYRFDESKTEDPNVLLQEVYDVDNDSMLGNTRIRLNEQGLVDKRIEEWTTEPGLTETYTYNAAGQKMEVKTMVEHDHEGHEGHDHGDDSALTIFTYDDKGTLVKEVSTGEGQSMTTEYRYGADGKLTGLVMTEEGEGKKVTEIAF